MVGCSSPKENVVIAPYCEDTLKSDGITWISKMMWVDSAGEVVYGENGLEISDSLTAIQILIRSSTRQQKQYQELQHKYDSVIYVLNKNIIQ